MNATFLSLCAIAIANCATAQSVDKYTVNGHDVAPEMGMLLKHYGFEPGPYFIDMNGNYGKSGSDPSGNISGGPVWGWTGLEPTTVQGNLYASTYIQGVTGLRIFWVFKASPISNISGGGSGYIHICPGNMAFASSEGATSVRTPNGAYGGAASTHNRTGTWSVNPGLSGPELSARWEDDGEVQSVPLTTLLQGKWQSGRNKYVVEQGKAECW